MASNNDFMAQLTAGLNKKASAKQINADIKELQKTIGMLRLTATLLRGDSKKAIKQQITQIQAQLAPIKLSAKIDEKAAQRAVNSALKNVKLSDIDINTQGLKLKVQKAVSSATSRMPKITIPINYEMKREKLQNDLTAYLTKNSKIRESSGLLKEADELREVFSLINDKKSSTEAIEKFKLFKSEVQATGHAGLSTTDKLQNMLSKIGQIGSMFGAGAMLINRFNDSLKTLRSNSTIMTEIAKTSEMTAKQLQEISDSSFGIASKYGVRSSGYLEGVREMARSGYDSLSKELGELSVLAQSAGDMTADSANNYLLATDAAYKYKGSIEMLTAALDGANYISNRNSATLTDIADGVRVSASYAAEAGVQIDELTAAEATMIATTKRSGSEMGRAFRSILLNLQQVSGEFDGEIIDEESLKKVEDRCHSLGIELETLTAEGAKLRNPMEVLEELAQVYNSLPDNSVDKQGIISDIGGKYHANALSSLLSNWSSYEKMLSEFSQGSGSSLKESAKTAESWEGRLNSLQNQWDSFVNHVTDQDTIKTGLSFFDTAIGGAEKLVDILGAIPTLLTTITGAYTLLNKDYGVTQIINPQTGKMDLQGSYMGINITNLKAEKKHFAEAEQAIAKWNAKVSEGLTDINKFGESVVKNNAQLKDYLSTCTDGNASLAGYRASLKAAGVQTDSLRLKTVLMTSAMSLGIGLLIQGGISLLTKIIDEQVHAQERAIEAAEEANSRIKSLNDTYTTHKNVVEDTASAYEELAKGVDRSNNRNISLGEEDYQKYLDINKQIAEAFPELIIGFDDQGQAILDLGKNGRSAAEDLQQLLKVEEDLKNFKISKEISTVFEGTRVQVEKALASQKAYDEQISQNRKALENLNSITIDGISLDNAISFKVDTNNEASTTMYSAISQAIGEFKSGLSSERSRELINLGDYLDITIGDNNTTDDVFDFYFSTFNLTSDEKAELQNLIKQQGKTLAREQNDILGDSIQSELADTKEANIIWKDFLFDLSSAMKSKQSFNELDSSVQEFAAHLVRNLPMTVVAEMDKYDDPYKYIVSSFISPLTDLSDSDRKEVIEAYNKLLAFDPEKLSATDSAKSVNEYVKAITSHLNFDDNTIKEMFGLEDIDQVATDINRLINESVYDFQKRIIDELRSLEQAGAIDLVIRPQIDTSKLEQAGWGHQEPGTATVYSSTYTNEEGTKAVVVTPILPDGSVLSPEDLEAYANDLLAGKKIDADVKMGIFSGEDALKQADEFAGRIHELHEAYFTEGPSGTKDELVDFFTKMSINTAEEIGLWKKVSTEVNTASEAMKAYASAKQMTTGQNNEFVEKSLLDTITQLDEMANKWKTVNALYTEFTDKDSKGFSSETLSNMAKSFKDIQGVNIDDFLQVLTDSKSTTEDVQEAFDKLATEYIYSSGCLEGLTDATAEQVARELELQGVTNASAIVTQYLAAQKEWAKYSTSDLANATLDEVAAVITENSILKDSKQFIAGYALQKEIANGTTLDTSGDIANLASLVGALGSTNTALEAYNKVKFGGDSSALLGAGSDGAKAMREAAQVELENAMADFEAKVKNGLGSFGGSVSNKKSGAGGSGSKSAKEPTEFDWMEQRIKVIDSRVDKLKDNIDVLVGYRGKNNTTNTAIDQLIEKMSILQQMHDKYMQEAGNIGLSQEYIDKIQNGALEIESISDENLVKQIKQFQSLYNSAEESSKQIDETAQAIKEMNLSKLDNIIDQFDDTKDSISQLIDYQKEYLELRQNAGEEIYSDDYSELIEMQGRLVKENSDAYNKLANEMGKMDLEKGSEEWIKYNNQLQEYKSKIMDAASATKEYMKQMVELEFKDLTDYVSKMNSVSGTISTMTNLIGNVGLTDDKGKLTDLGLAQVALYAQQMANAKQEAAEYTEAMRALDDMLDSSLITQDEYNEKLYDYTSAQESAITASKAAKDAILSLVKDGIQAEIDAKKELVDQTIAAMKAEQDLHDYQMSISEKQDNISKLERQIAALGNSTNRDDIAQRLQLQSELADAKKELYELQYDHEIEQREEALNKEYNAYEETKNKEIEELDSNLDAQNAAINKFLEEVKSKYSTVYGVLTQYGDEYSIAAIENLSDPWSKSSEAADLCAEAIGTAVSDIQYNIDSLDFTPLFELIDTLNSLGISYGEIGASGNAGFEDISSQGSWRTGKDGKDWFGEKYNPDGDYFYASDGIYTINGNQYGFDEDGYMLNSGWDDRFGQWRYFEPANGQMVKSTWREDKSGNSYYLDKNGVMATDSAIKAKDGNDYYYVDDNGMWDGQTMPYDEVKRRGLTVAYKKGIKRVPHDQLAWTQEGKPEIITRPSDGAILTPLKAGDGVINGDLTENLLELAKDPDNSTLMKLREFAKNYNPYDSGYLETAARVTTPDLSKIRPVQTLVIDSPLVQIDGTGMSAQAVAAMINNEVQKVPKRVVEQIRYARLGK